VVDYLRQFLWAVVSVEPWWREESYGDRESGGDRKRVIARKASHLFRRFTVFEKLVDVDRTRLVSFHVHARDHGTLSFLLYPG
jgi:hypothetical protein